MESDKSDKLGKAMKAIGLGLGLDGKPLDRAEIAAEIQQSQAKGSIYRRMAKIRRMCQGIN